MSTNPEPVTYAYSVKLESTARGLIMPTVHVYSNDMDTARKQAIEQYHHITQELREKGISIASQEAKS